MQILILFCLLLVQCVYPGKHALKEDDIKGIKVLLSAPVPIELKLNEQGIFQDSVFIFHYKDYVLYKMPYLATTTIITVDKAGNYLGERAVDQVKNNYFIYKNSGTAGSRYDSVNATTAQRLHIDSFLNNNGFASFALPKDFRETNMLTDSSAYNGQIVMKYATKPPADVKNYDSIYLYFSSRFTDIPFSLAEVADILPNKKLYRMQYLYNRKYDTVHAVEVPKREFLLTIEQANLHDHPEIGLLFQRYISEND